MSFLPAENPQLSIESHRKGLAPIIQDIPTNERIWNVRNVERIELKQNQHTTQRNQHIDPHIILIYHAKYPPQIQIGT